MSYPKLTPIIAKGATEPRYLEDRFIDTVSVKDFGAKGDGVTDDTIAFETAAATGKSIFVPKGSYNLSKSVVGKFYSNEELVFTNAVCEVFCIQFAYQENRKAIRFVTDLRFPDYTEALGKVVAIHSTVTYIYPQACCYGIKDGIEKLYVYYQAGAAQVSTNILVIFDITNNQYEKYYVLPDSYVGEGLIYNIDDNVEYIYAPSTLNSKKKAKYALTGASGSVLTATQDDFCNTPGGTPFFSKSDSGEWLVLGGAAQTVDTTEGLTVYNDSAEYVSQVAWDKWDFDTLTDYNAADPEQMGIPHKQGLFYDSGKLYIFAGGSSNTPAVWNVSDIGVIQKSFSGGIEKSSVCKSEKVKPIFASMLGKSVKFTENEGGYVHDQKVYSLDIVVFTDDTEKIVLLEEFSKSANSVDFSSAISSTSNASHYAVRRFFPCCADGKFRNPFSDEEMSTLDDFVAFISRYGIPELVVDFYATSVDLTLSLDDNGVTSEYNLNSSFTNNPVLIRFIFQTKLSIFVEVYERNKKTCYILYLNSDYSGRLIQSLPVAAGGLLFWGRDSYGAGYRISGQLKNTGLLLLSNVSVGNQITIGDGSETRPQLITLACTNASADEIDSTKNYAVLLYDYAFRPNTTNAVNLGSSAIRWKNIYTDANAVTTSDARFKTDISDINEKVLKAWGKIRLKVFKFISSVNKKGEDKARLHSGLIAQEVQEAFVSEGVDPNKYGFFCYDEWEDQYEENPVPGSKDEFGNLQIERKLVMPAGNMYSIRYEEALVLECAYLRWRLEKLEERVEQLINNSNK